MFGRVFFAMLGRVSFLLCLAGFCAMLGRDLPYRKWFSTRTNVYIYFTILGIFCCHAGTGYVFGFKPLVLFFLFLDNSYQFDARKHARRGS